MSRWGKQREQLQSVVDLVDIWNRCNPYLKLEFLGIVDEVHIQASDERTTLTDACSDLNDDPLSDEIGDLDY